MAETEKNVAKKGIPESSIYEAMKPSEALAKIVGMNRFHGQR